MVGASANCRCVLKTAFLLSILAIGWAGMAWAQVNQEAAPLFERLEGVNKILQDARQDAEYERRQLEKQGASGQGDASHEEDMRRRLSAHLRPGGRASASHGGAMPPRRWSDRAMEDVRELEDRVVVLRASLGTAQLSDEQTRRKFEAEMEELEVKAHRLKDRQQ